MTDLYQYLPGFTIEYKDGGLTIPRETVTTNSVTLIGTATDGPKHEPVSVYRPEDAELVFGKPYNVANGIANGTSLLLGMLESYNAGCRDIRLVRVGGEFASANIEDITAVTPGKAIKLTAVYAGSLYNNTAYTVIVVESKATTLTITKPAEKGSSTLTFNITPTMTIEELIKLINDNPNNNVVIAELGEDGILADVAADVLAVKPATKLTGGSDGLNMTADDTYHEMYHAYQAIEDYETDSISVLGLYADDVYPVGHAKAGEEIGYAEQLANHCANVSERGIETFGVIACKPIATVSQTNVKTKVTALRTRTNANKYYKIKVTHDEEAGTFTFPAYEKNVLTGIQISVGHYVNVVAMPELQFVHPVIGRYYAPGAAAYAGLISSLPAESAPTNKILSNVRSLRYKLSPAQLNDLTEYNYVTFKNRTEGVAVTDGCTASAPLANGQKSDYSRLSTMRIVFAAVKLVREEAEPFIGEPNELPQRNALNTAIKSGLNKMKTAGAITAHRFSITATLEQKILGESYIDLELVPALENRKIRVNVSLRATF